MKEIGIGIVKYWNLQITLTPEMETLGTTIFRHGST